MSIHLIWSNKVGVHGRTDKLRVIAEHYVRYVLNLAAPTILLLIEAIVAPA
jgi:hypothetical protein